MRSLGDEQRNPDGEPLAKRPAQSGCSVGVVHVTSQPLAVVDDFGHFAETVGIEI